MTNLQFYGGYIHVATYWQLLAVDGFGKRRFAAPILVNTYWQERTDLVIKAGTEQIPSKAEVFLQEDITVGEYLALGDFTSSGNLTPDPVSIPSEAFQILSFHRNTSLMGEAHFRSAVL